MNKTRIILTLILFFGVLGSLTFGACHDCWQWNRYKSNYYGGYNYRFYRTSPVPYHYLRWLWR